MKVGALVIAKLLMVGVVQGQAPKAHHFADKVMPPSAEFRKEEKVQSPSADLNDWQEEGVVFSGKAPSSNGARQYRYAPATPPPLKDDDDSVVLSPTPLSMMDGDELIYELSSDQDQEFLPNVALNASFMLSSSTGSGTFGRLGEESQVIRTGSEQDPYLVVNLNDLYYVDQISFNINVDEESLYSKLLLWCTDEQFSRSMIRSDVAGLHSSWQKIMLQNVNNVSVHVHSPCQVLRVQRMSFGNIRLSNLKIFAGRVKNKDVIQCLSAHDGTVCTNHGTCVNNECVCSYGYSGRKCDVFLMSGYFWNLTQSFLLVLAFAYGTWRIVNNNNNKGNGEDEDGDELGKQKQQLRFDESLNTSIFRSSGELGGSEEDGSLLMPTTLRQSSCPTKKSIWSDMTDDDTKTEESRNSTGSLCLLFASPLVMNVKAEDGKEVFRPVQGLDIKREHGMLQQSLREAGCNTPIDVHCATMQAFHKLLTLGDIKILHMSLHSTKSFVGFEDQSGALHSVSMAMLRNVLRSTITAKSFKKLRLVLLNSCNSKQAALEFVLAGVPNVICMNKKVRDTTAQIFTRSFYLALATGRTVRDAFESAKEAVYSSPNFSEKEADCFVLLPEKAPHNDVILTPSELRFVKDMEWPPCNSMSRLPPLCDDFCGRHGDVFNIIRHLQTDKRRFVVLQGSNGSGKTQVANAVAHYLHERRSISVLPDGVFFLKNNIDSRFDSLSQYAALVDHVWKTLFPLIVDSENEMVQHMDTLVDEDEEDSDNEDGETMTKEDEKELKRRIESKVRVLIRALADRDVKCMLVISNLKETRLVLKFLSKLLDSVTGLQLLVTSRISFVSCDSFNVNVINYELGPITPGDAALLLARHLKRKFTNDTKELPLPEVAQHPFLLSLEGNPKKVIQAALKLNQRFPGHSAINLDMAQRS